MIVNMGNNRLNNPNVLPTCMCLGMDNPGGTSVELGRTILSYLTAPRLLWIPNGTGVADTTEPDLSGNGNTATYKGTHSIAAKGFGRVDTFDGATAYCNIADTDTLSFGNGTNDSPFSVIFATYVPNLSATQYVFTKWNITAGTREYQLGIQGNEKPIIYFLDTSAAKFCYRPANTANTTSWCILGMSYDGGGGATAANGIHWYRNGVLDDGTATNDAGYVAMENLTCPVSIGSKLDGGVWAEGYSGIIAYMAVTAEVVSGPTMLNIYNSTRGYLGI